MTAPEPSRDWNRLGRAAARLAAVGAFGFAALLFLRPIWDIDIFWHLAAGRAIAERQSLPTTDIFGFDPSRTWVPFQWGYELLVHYLYSAGGFAAIRALHTAVMCIAFAWLYRSYLRWTDAATAGVLWAATLLLYQDRINVRPDVFNLLGLAMLLPWLLGDWRRLPSRLIPRTADERRAVLQLGFTAAAMTVWAAFHAGGCLNHLIAASAVPVGASVGALARRPRGHGDAGEAWLFWLALAVPCVLVPNFVAGSIDALFLVQTTGGVIGEWSPPIAYVLGPDPQPLGRILTGLAPYALLLWLLVLGLGRRLREYPLPELGLVIAFTGLSLLFARFVYFVAPAALILINVSAYRFSWRRSVLIIAGLFGLVWHVNVSSLYGGLAPLAAATHAPVDERRFPVAAADYLETIGFRGRIYAHARYGSYLLFRLYPAATVRIDGRLCVPSEVAEAVQYAHEHQFDQLEDDAVAARIDAIYEASTADALVLESPGFGPGRPDCDRWVLAFRTPKEEVWLRPSTARTFGVAIGACGKSSATIDSHVGDRVETHSRRGLPGAVASRIDQSKR